MKLLGLLIIFSSCFLSLGQHLGLLHKLKEITIAKGEDIRQVEIVLPVANTKDEFTNNYNSMKSSYEKVKNIPGLAENTEHFKAVGYLFKQISNDLSVMQVSIEAMTKYRDLNNDRPVSTICGLTWKTYKPSTLDDYVKILKALTDNLANNSDAAYFTANKDKLADIKTLLEKMAYSVAQANSLFFDRVQIMDLLSNKQIHAEVLVGIQQMECMLKGELEKTEILHCEKTKAGLLCVLEATVFTNFQKFDLYTPINYKGIQLKIDGDYLVKTGSDWFTLNCFQDTNLQLDSFDHCEQVKLNTDCSNILNRENIDPFIKNCEFEKVLPKTGIISQDGILVQGEEVEVLLLDSLTDYRPDKITETPPLLVATNRIVRTNKKNFEETFHPVNRVATEKIITTWLTESDIKSLESKINIEEILGFDYYMEIGGVSVLSIVILVLGYIFKKQRALNQLLGNDAENQVKKSKAKKNLKENVRVQL
jgi:hypothetical protein